MRLRTTLQLHGKNATGIELPASFVETLGGGKRPKITVTINGVSYPSSVGTMSGRFLVAVSADIRARTGVAAGDQIDVDIVPDTEPRIVEVPADLAAALARVPEARQAFDRLSYTGRQRHVLSVEQAKTPETRQRRIDKAVSELSGIAAS